MNIQELKERITEDILSDDLLVLMCEDNYFLANQYVQEICKVKGLEINYVHSIQDVLGNTLMSFLGMKSILNVLKVDTFSEKTEDYSLLENTVIICNKIDKKISSRLTNYTVKVPKLLEWQIEDYVKLFCTGLTATDINWLCQAANNDIYKIMNEVDKITLFSPKEQKAVFDTIKYDSNTDLYNLQIYKLADAIVMKDREVINGFLMHKDCCDFDPIAIVNMVLNKLKLILLLTQNRNLTAADVGISDKQANGIRYYYKNYPMSGILNKIKFLSNIDLRLKSSELTMSKDYLIDYVICHLMAY